MNARALRRLAADHGALHHQPLPPNYLFPPDAGDVDDLTQLDIWLAGPAHTPFSAGVFKLHLTIPPTYPQQPPAAHFRTPIFHPNVDPQTGAVCVETLKRDWDAKLTLRDILVVIACLLIQPNPDSALNAEAGSLIQDEYAAFARRAVLMTSIHAVVPPAMRHSVAEAQNRGQEILAEPIAGENRGEMADVDAGHSTPPRRDQRGATARRRGTTAARRSDSPRGAPAQPFVLSTSHDDVFGAATTPPRRRNRSKSVSDDSMMDADQENDDTRSPAKAKTPKATTPRRPHGAPVPLGELTLDDPSSDEDSAMVEAEYPPSPQKSPLKSVTKQRPPTPDPSGRAESSRDALRRALPPHVTPPYDPSSKPLAADSPFAPSADLSPSPRKTRLPQPLALGKPATKPSGLFSLSPPRHGSGVFKPRWSSASEKKRQEDRKKARLDEALWQLCGGDVQRWNRGDFDGEPFAKKAARW